MRKEIRLDFAVPTVLERMKQALSLSTSNGKTNKQKHNNI